VEALGRFLKNSDGVVREEIEQAMVSASAGV